MDGVGFASLFVIPQAFYPIDDHSISVTSTSPKNDYGSAKDLKRCSVYHKKREFRSKIGSSRFAQACLRVKFTPALTLILAQDWYIFGTIVLYEASCYA